MNTKNPEPSASTEAGAPAPTWPEFDDLRVQLVYDILCDDNTPPAETDERWEGFAARRIAAALAPPGDERAPTAQHQELIAQLEEMVTFLCGAGELRGGTYGEKHPAYRGMYWWRTPLRTLEKDIVAALAAPSPPERAEPGLSERWVIVRETALDVGQGDDVRTGGRPELGYALLANAATFDGQDAARIALRETGLPIGWVLMPLSRLLPDLSTQLTTQTRNAAFADDHRSPLLSQSPSQGADRAESFSQPPVAWMRLEDVPLLRTSRGATIYEAKPTNTMQAMPMFAAPGAELAVAWPQEKSVKRRDDMSASDALQVGLDSDNDVMVSLWTEQTGYSSVEFCNGGGNGGGRSPRTRMALIALMVAMEADNAAAAQRSGDAT